MIQDPNQSLMDRAWPELVAVLITTTGFVFSGDFGLGGVLGSVAVVLAWYYLPIVYTVAVGHLLVAALTIGEFTTFAIIMVEVGLFGMMLTTTPILYDRRTVTSMTVFMLGLLVFTFGIAFVTSEALWIGVLALLVVGALVTYGMHRYELVSLGLVEGLA